MIGLWMDTTRGFGQRGRVEESRATSTRPGIRFIDLTGVAGAHHRIRIRIREQRAPGKKTVVFACDGPNTLEHYDGLLAELEGRADVIVFDPPGTGCSEPPHYFGFRIRDYAEVTLALLEALELRDATLVFPCYLGFVAAFAASLDGRRIARLVLPQTPSFQEMTPWCDRVDRRRLLRTPMLGQATVALRRREVARSWYRAAIPDGARRSAFVTAADEAFSAGGCFCLASLLQRWSTEVFPDVRSITLPVDIVWGMKDRSHRASRADGFRHHLPSARVITFEDLGHSSDLEDPSAFVDRVLFAEERR
jgi:pimeloyl-ACP methyl ester carboxylesterase